MNDVQVTFISRYEVEFVVGLRWTELTYGLVFFYPCPDVAFAGHMEYSLDGGAYTTLKANPLIALQNYKGRTVRLRWSYPAPWAGLYSVSLGFYQGKLDGGHLSDWRNRVLEGNGSDANAIYNAYLAKSSYEVTYIKPIATPQQIEVSTTNTTADITWGTVQNAQGYEFLYKKSSGSAWNCVGKHGSPGIENVSYTYDMTWRDESNDYLWEWMLNFDAVEGAVSYDIELVVENHAGGHM